MWIRGDLRHFSVTTEKYLLTIDFDALLGFAEIIFADTLVFPKIGRFDTANGKSHVYSISSLNFLRFVTSTCTVKGFRIIEWQNQRHDRYSAAFFTGWKKNRNRIRSDAVLTIRGNYSTISSVTFEILKRQEKAQQFSRPQLLSIWNTTVPRGPIDPKCGIWFHILNSVPLYIL